MNHIQIAYFVGVIALVLFSALCGYVVGFWCGLGHARSQYERAFQPHPELSHFAKRGMQGGH